MNAIPDPVHVTRRGRVLEVVLDRPKANAIDAATSRRLGDVFKAFRDDPELRVAVLTAAGEKFFCPGWDLKAAADGDAFLQNAKAVAAAIARLKQENKKVLSLEAEELLEEAGEVPEPSPTSSDMSLTSRVKRETKARRAGHERRAWGRRPGRTMARGRGGVKEAGRQEPMYIPWTGQHRPPARGRQQRSAQGATKPNES